MRYDRLVDVVRNIIGELQRRAPPAERRIEVQHPHRLDPTPVDTAGDRESPRELAPTLSFPRHSPGNGRI